MSLFSRHKTTVRRGLFYPSLPGLLMFGATLAGVYYLWPMLGFERHPWVEKQRLSSEVVGYSTPARPRIDRLTVTDVISVYDGDTFRVESVEMVSGDGRGIPIRVRGIDAAEIQGRCDKESRVAIVARDWLRTRLASTTTIELVDIDLEEDRYGRAVARVLLDGDDLATEMLSKRLAAKWVPGSRADWCR